MRGIIWQDIDTLARHLAPMCEDDRLPAIENIIRRAEYADAYRKRHGHIHAGFGDGSIASAIGHLPPQRRADDPTYLRSLALVCDTFAERAERHVARRAA